MYNKVEVCGVNTATLKVLTENDKIRLAQAHARRRTDGAGRSWSTAICDSVLSVHSALHRERTTLDDLFRVGCIGLIKAIDNFDVTQNVQLLHLRRPQLIIGEIRRYLRHNSSIPHQPIRCGTPPTRPCRRRSGSPDRKISRNPPWMKSRTRYGAAEGGGGAWPSESIVRAGQPVRAGLFRRGAERRVSM